jgi:hypothetical protein
MSTNPHLKFCPPKAEHISFYKSKDARQFMNQNREIALG